MPVHFDELTLDDVYSGIAAIKRGKSHRFRRVTGGGVREVEADELSNNSVYDAIVILKPFLLWLSKRKIIKIKTDEIKENVKAIKRNKRHLDMANLLTPEEVLTIINAANTVRDRSLLYVLYESGARSAEVARLMWKDANFDEYGAGLTIMDTKENTVRYSRLISGAQALLELKNNYGRPVTPDSYIFSNNDGTPLTYAGMNQILKRALKRTEIEKHVTLHGFRHARATHMVVQGYQESIIKQSLWGNVNTKMFDVYVSLGKEAIDTEFLKRAGITVQKNEIDNPMSARQCHHCGKVNGPDTNYCGKCGRPLTKEAQTEEQSAINQIEQTEAYKKLKADMDAQLEKIRQELLGNSKQK